MLGRKFKMKFPQQNYRVIVCFLSQNITFQLALRKIPTGIYRNILEMRLEDFISI